MFDALLDAHRSGIFSNILEFYTKIKIKTKSYHATLRAHSVPLQHLDVGQVSTRIY